MFDKLVRHGNEENPPSLLGHPEVLGVEDSITHSDGFGTEKACFMPLATSSSRGFRAPQKPAEEAPKSTQTSRTPITLSSSPPE